MTRFRLLPFSLFCHHEMCAQPVELPAADLAALFPGGAPSTRFRREVGCLDCGSSRRSRRGIAGYRAACEVLLIYDLVGDKP